jgi:hypothetical protein
VQFGGIFRDVEHDPGRGPPGAPAQRPVAHVVDLAGPPLRPDLVVRCAARKRAGQLAPVAAAAMRRVERPGGGVLLQDPQVEPGGGAAAGHRPGGLGDQAAADSAALQVVPPVPGIQVGPPGRVRVEDDVRKARDLAIEVGHDGMQPGLRPGQPGGPLGHPVGQDVAVEVGVQVRAPVVTLPAVGVQAGDGGHVARRCLPVLHGRCFLSGGPVPGRPAAIVAIFLEF